MNKIEEILQKAGVQLDGPNPWDPKINYQKTTKEKLVKRILSGGSLAAGESYMDGEWDCEQLDVLIYKVFTAKLDVGQLFDREMFTDILMGKFFNYQSIKRAFQVGEEHYDIGNDLYDAMLDKSTKSYTCAYWKNAENLDEAQIAKLDLVCRKLQLKPGERVLDIGCGWGNFMCYAAEKYGVKCVGLTVSKEQAKQGKILAGDLPVEFVLTDYRLYTAKEKFDKIVSIGMFEHVGYKNYRAFMEVAERNLKDNGLFLLHTIGNAKTVSRGDAWVSKYIFPNGFLPSISQIVNAFKEKVAFFTKPLFQLEDWHNFGIYYDLTLMEWYKNFDKAFPELSRTNVKYDQRFYRMFKYYLLTCAGMFRARHIHLWQIVLSKDGVPGGYESIR
jgi:cyclopropane-fatty-acyl-phospholipid synthase